MINGLKVWVGAFNRQAMFVDNTTKIIKHNEDKILKGFVIARLSFDNESTAGADASVEVPKLHNINTL